MNARVHVGEAGAAPRRGSQRLALGLFFLLLLGAWTLLLALLAAATAQAASPPALAWSPTTSSGTYNYGTLTAGTTQAATFTLTNSGGSATAMLAISLTGSGAFTVTADNCTGTSLGPRKSCSVTVQYAPTSPGETDSATLQAISKKPAASASIELTGQSAKAGPSLTTTPSPSAVTIGIGTVLLNDSAVLSGGANPTGMITFTLCAPGGTPVYTDKVTVSGNGTYTTASGDNPGGYTPTVAGTYQWNASYWGDSSNNAASDQGSSTERESVN